ncbi:hypothetical protein ABPG77_003919 [Micractinium sp. CCAP 211/92]
MSRPVPLLLAAAAGGMVVLAFQRLLASVRRAQQAAAADDHANGAEDKIEQGPSLRGPPPHPDWRPPQKQPPPFPGSEMHTVDPAQTTSDVLYPLIISAVVPRPIAFVSTENSEGVGNLAPFSYFNVMSHNPPHVAIGFAASSLRPHGRKDTLVNILETGEFVVNIMSEWFIEAANHTCGNFDYGDNEMEISGLTPLPSVKVKPPRVAESALHMECVLRHSYELKDPRSGKATGTIVIGEVLLMHVHEGVAGRSPSGKLVVDIEKYQPMSRLGGNTYARTSGLFDLPRPDRALGGQHAQQPLKYTSTPA